MYLKKTCYTWIIMIQSEHKWLWKIKKDVRNIEQFIDKDMVDCFSFHNLNKSHFVLVNIHYMNWIYSLISIY